MPSSVRCWGSNGAGELAADPARIASSWTPLPVSGLASPPASLTLASGYACAVTSDHYLYGWGKGPPDPQVRRAAVAGYQASVMYFNGIQLASVTTASVGQGGGCTTLLDGSLVCWGAFGARGVFDATVPLDGGPVTIPDSFETVVVGRAHACGIATRGTTRDVECWGANARGQVGIQSTSAVPAPTPVGLENRGRILQVAVGGDDSCAVLSDGSVYCWGANDTGQLGSLVEAGVDAATPSHIPLPHPAKQVAVGNTHVCALLDDGSVVCWGDNSAAQIGIGTAGGRQVTPTNVLRFTFGVSKLLQGVGQIAAGGQTTCALGALGSPIWCWGANDSGQAGQPPSAEAGLSVVPYATAMAL